MPVFALANAGVALDASTLGAAEGRGVALAVTAGLLLGKPLGIALFALAAVRLGLAALPVGVGTGALFGVGLLGGIGFTMALPDRPHLRRDAARLGREGRRTLRVGARLRRRAAGASAGLAVSSGERRARAGCKEAERS
jgi:hypothetical protein